MNKRGLWGYILIGIGVLVLIGAIIFIVIISFLFSGLRFDKEIKFCMKMSSNYQVRCVSSIAIERNDVGVCTKTFILNSLYKSDCIMSYVKGTGDAESCNLISNELIVDNCFLNSISKNPDPLICEKISETFYRNDCYYDIAEKTKNQQYCNYINEDCDKDKRCTWLKGTCVSVALKK